MQLLCVMAFKRHCFLWYALPWWSGLPKQHLESEVSEHALKMQDSGLRLRSRSIAQLHFSQLSFSSFSNSLFLQFSSSMPGLVAVGLPLSPPHSSPAL